MVSKATEPQISAFLANVFDTCQIRRLRFPARYEAQNKAFPRLYGLSRMSHERPRGAAL